MPQMERLHVGYVEVNSAEYQRTVQSDRRWRLCLRIGLG